MYPAQQTKRDINVKGEVKQVVNNQVFQRWTSSSVRSEEFQTDRDAIEPKPRNTATDRKQKPTQLGAEDKFLKERLKF